MKKHKFSHTVIEHHKDGSHTVHHIHEKHGHQGPGERDGDVRGAAPDHDSMVDHLMDHTSNPNPGEEENESPEQEAAEEAVHPGIHAQAAKVAAAAE